MSKNTQMNLIYLVVLVPCIILLVVVGFAMNNVIGYLAYLAITIIVGLIVLWQKQRLTVWWIWLILWFSAGFGFPIAVLCLGTKEKRSHTHKQ